jgi:hypothetical protein
VPSTAPPTAAPPNSAWTPSCSRSGAPASPPSTPSTPSPTGITIWRAELLAYFDEPTTNGYAEGVINKVKVIKRRAYGLPTFTGFRKRVVIACG